MVHLLTGAGLEIWNAEEIVPHSLDSANNEREVAVKQTLCFNYSVARERVFRFTLSCVDRMDCLLNRCRLPCSKVMVLVVRGTDGGRVAYSVTHATALSNVR